MATRRRRRRGTVNKPAAGRQPLDHIKLQQMREDAKRDRQYFERDWRLNTAFISGEQQVGWNIKDGRLVELDVADGDQLPMRNFMLKISRTERSKILKTIPEARAVPVSTDATDEREARTMNSWFSQCREEWQFERRLRTATFWVVATGNVFLKWFWSGGKPQMTVVNPFDVYVDPYSPTIIDARWMMHSMFMSMDEAHETYGKKGNTSHLQETAMDAHSGIESRIFLPVGMFSGTGQQLPGAVITEYYQKPTVGDPAGRYIVFANSGIIYDSDFPYDHDMLPFTHVGHIERANSKYYASIMDAIRPIQIEANRAEADVVRNRNASQGKWFLPLNLELDQDPDAQFGQILRQIGGEPGLTPELIVPSTIPPWVAEEPMRLQSVAEDIAGQHEVSNAGVPGRVEAAQAIQLLQEADDALLKDVTHSLNEAVQLGFMMTAFNTKQFGDPKIIVQATDKDGKVAVDEMLTDELRMNFRIQVQTTTALPHTISGKWDRVMTLVQNQIISPQRALKLLGLTTEDPDFNDDQQDRNRQYEYNKRMAKGEIVRPALWENHTACLDELNKYRKTSEFDQLPENTKAIFAFHATEREEMQKIVAQNEAELMMIAQGGAIGAEGGQQVQPPAPGPAGQVVS